METVDKKTLRKSVREAVKAMNGGQKRMVSEGIVFALREQIERFGAKVVALFSPLPDEPMIGALIHLLPSTANVVLPRVEGEVMHFYPCLNSELEIGSYGIMEPQGNVPVEPSEIDLIVVPGVAFAKDGARMGRGKGYYDKYMSQEGFNAYKIGVCYAVQLVDTIPAEPHDIAVDIVISK